MNNSRKIKVLIVDDSILFREVIARGISSDLGIEIVGTAIDPYDARDKILEYEPDVMTCDIEMPKMNGIEFIKRLMPQYPIPVVVVSTISDAVFKAMNAGAVDFVTKPDMRSAKSVEAFINELVTKIKIAALSKVFKDNVYRSSNTMLNGDSNITGSRAIARKGGKIIAIGASTGGTEAIYSVLRNLPATVPGIVIVQHIPPVFSRMFAERLDNSTRFKVREAQNNDFIERGSVLIAPGDSHMRVKRACERYKVEVFNGEKINGHCPSVDVLFESAAKECGEHAIGIILTGMGYDGAKGLLEMRRKGARTIGQDEKSSVVYGMPKVAYNIGAVERQISIGDIPNTICSMLGGDYIKPL